MKVVNNTVKLYEALLDGIEGLHLKRRGYHTGVGYYELLVAVTEREIPKRFLWITWTKKKKMETNLLLVLDNHRVEIAEEDKQLFGARVSAVMQDFESEHCRELILVIVDNLMGLPAPVKGKKK